MEKNERQEVEGVPAVEEVEDDSKKRPGATLGRVRA